MGKARDTATDDTNRETVMDDDAEPGLGASKGVGLAPQTLGVLGPTLALGTIALVEVAARLDFRVPNPPAILMTICVFSAFSGGFATGSSPAS